jgi:hypothetical protein
MVESKTSRCPKEVFRIGLQEEGSLSKKVDNIQDQEQPQCITCLGCPSE